MKLKSPFWQSSLITFAVMISGYVGFMLCDGTKGSPSLFLGVAFLFMMFVGGFALAASLLLWFLAGVASLIRSHRAKS